MPGLVAASSAASVGAIAGMKRTLAGEAADISGQPQKKRKVVHQLHHTQPIEHIVEHVSAENYRHRPDQTGPTVQNGPAGQYGESGGFGETGETKEFFDQQLKRAIAVEFKAAGFDSARPEALERMRALTDSFMRTFLAQVRKSMSSARRTTTVPHDWIYALKGAGIEGSSVLEPHLDTGEVPKALLQPFFPPPEPADPPPPDVEGLLGPELSGRQDKESRSYIPAHFPPFPPKHSWKATPVYTQRETDPRKIREKATEEGIRAEQSLRKLMAAQKAGLQKNKARRQRKSKRMKESVALWQDAMKDLLKEEEQRAEAERIHQEEMDDEEYVMESEPRPRPKVDTAPRLQEDIHINYEQKFMRKSARGF